MKKQEDEEIELFFSVNDIETNQICVILQENNIPYIKKDDGIGSYMNLYYGHSTQGKRILVNKRNYDRAIELVKPFLVNAQIEEGIPELEEEVEDGENQKRYSNLRMIIKIWIIGLPILLIILMILAILKDL